MKRLVLCLFALLLCTGAAGAAFADVPQSAWYAPAAETMQREEILNGVSDNRFGAGRPMTLAQAATLTARLHVKVTGNAHSFSDSGIAWDAPYTAYLSSLGLSAETFGARNAPVTRADMAVLLYAALRSTDALAAQTEIADGAILDVAAGRPCEEAVYALYRAGVLSGTDHTGRFHPDKLLLREEAAVIASRILDPALRVQHPLSGSPIAARPGTHTLRNLLITALQPVGSTMYIWGGGWNEADTGAGPEAVTIGTSPRWAAFFAQQDSSYDRQQFRYRIHDGLDCSGYIGWTIYNVVNTEDDRAGYVYLAGQMAQVFSQQYGWGSFTPADAVRDHRAGDLMSAAGHVYLTVGPCADGSIVLLHSSPNGVQLCGTATPSGNLSSEAATLAAHYMQRYFAEWYRLFPRVTRDASYLTDYNRLRWDLSGAALLTDPDGLAEKSAAEVLKNLFAE